MQKLVFRNSLKEIDLTGGNYGITNWEGLSGVDLDIQTQTVPFVDGSVYLDSLLENRELSFTVAIQDNNDLALRYELKRKLISALNPKLGEGELFYTNDFTAVKIKAVPHVPIFENKNSNDSGTLKASITFTACNPYWEDINTQEFYINNGETINIENNGDTEVNLKAIFLTGNIKNPKLQNFTTGKTLQLNGNFSESISINTDFGSKGVTQSIFVVENNYPPLTTCLGIFKCDGSLFFLIYNGYNYILFKLLNNNEPSYLKPIPVRNDRNTNYPQFMAKTNNKLLVVTNCYSTNYKYTAIYVTEDYDWEVVQFNNEHCLKLVTVGNMFIMLRATLVEGGYYEYKEPKLYKSTDGLNWEFMTDVPFIPEEIIVAHNTVYIYMYDEENSNNSVMVGNEAGNWEWLYTIYSEEPIIYRSMIYANGKFISVYNTAENPNTYNYSYSENGVTWVNSEYSFTLNEYSKPKIYYDDIKYIIYPDNCNFNNGVTFKISYNGVDWNEMQVPDDLNLYTNHFLNLMKFQGINGTSFSRTSISGSYFTSNDIICSTNDFITWNEIEYCNYKDIIYNGSNYIRISDGKFYLNLNKIDYLLNFGNTLRFSFMIAINDGFIVGHSYYRGADRVFKIKISENNFEIIPSSILPIQLEIVPDYRKIAYDKINGRIMILGAKGVLYSTDGINWDSHIFSEINDFEPLSIIYADNKFIIYCSDSTMSPSKSYVITISDSDFYNPENWSIIELANALAPTNLVYGNGTYIISGKTPEEGDEFRGNTFISNDLINWIELPYIINDVFFYKNSFYGKIDNRLVSFVNDEITKYFSYAIYNHTVEHDDKLLLIDDSAKADGLFTLYKAGEINVINDLSESSDMSFNFVEGINKVRFSYEEGQATAKIEFNNRYIGV